MPDNPGSSCNRPCLHDLFSVPSVSLWFYPIIPKVAQQVGVTVMLAVAIAVPSRPEPNKHSARKKVLTFALFWCITIDVHGHSVFGTPSTAPRAATTVRVTEKETLLEYIGEDWSQLGFAFPLGVTRLACGQRHRNFTDPSGECLFPLSETRE